eukprot:CAMPEP_0170608220 /NCGR_PEP_ID=MMETSP0224-20130122/21470_1 /TAXON_ID=285029 /ORGANISM="Togula jolla, Strain CCCM 725" /LENGTH=725 /DNA_ID=CAMNT_0010933435 /DNA_START=34 /DNA_END=2211 /DNA_ORIENTATION=-
MTDPFHESLQRAAAEYQRLHDEYSLLTLQNNLLQKQCYGSSHRLQIPAQSVPDRPRTTRRGAGFAIKDHMSLPEKEEEEEEDTRFMERISVQLSASSLSSSSSEREMSPMRRRTRAFKSMAFAKSETDHNGEHVILPLWPLWTTDATGPPVDPQLGLRSKTLTMTARGSTKSLMRSGDAVTDRSFCQRFVASPSSPLRVAWDLLSLLCISYDIVMVPMQVFPIGDPPELIAANLATTVFWMLDIVACFLLGYYAESVLEMRPCKVAKRYMMSWLSFDVLLVCMDWITMTTEESTVSYWSIFRVGKSVRFARILRIFRLLRLAKIWTSMGPLIHIYATDDLRAWLGIGKLLAVVVVFNHFVACTWFLIGNMQSDYNASWTDALRRNEVRDGRQSTSVSYWYSTALHWSITQFSPGSMEVVPRNSLERLFAVCTLLSGIVIFSSMVSSITATMNRLREMHAASAWQRMSVHRYLRESRISIRLANRILALLRKRSFAPERQPLHESDISILLKLPEGVLTALHCETYTPILCPHPLFNHIDQVDGGCFVDICHTASSQRGLANGQVLFRFGEVASKMYFVVSGELEYSFGVTEGMGIKVSEGWLSENVLWLSWEHRGRLSAISTCELVVVDAARCRDIIGRTSSMLLCYQAYAHNFREHLIEAGLDPSTWPECCSDLPLAFDVSQEMAQLSFEQHSDYEIKQAQPKLGRRIGPHALRTQAFSVNHFF